MPELFVNLQSFVACFVIMAGAQLIYATVGFGAGMVAVGLMALVLPDLTGVVVVLLILTFVTEVWVLTRTWRRSGIRLLGWLLPGMVGGLWLGIRLLLSVDVSLLKRSLGLVVICAGMYFFLEHRQPRPKEIPVISGQSPHPKWSWLSLPVGFFSGVLGAMFGTGGPPVIVYLRACRLDKTAFRATVLMYFLLMGVLRAGMYVDAGLVTVDRLVAAAMLLPGSIAGMIAGTIIHDRVSERLFSQIVSALLVVLGVLLVIGVGH